MKNEFSNSRGIKCDAKRKRNNEALSQAVQQGREERRG